MKISFAHICPLLLIACSEYDLEKVIDDELPPAEDTAVFVEPEPETPVAVAGPSLRAKRYEEIQLDGSASYHPFNPAIDLTYNWTLLEAVPNANVQFTPANEAKPAFSADVLGRYVAQLNVSDIYGEHSTNFAATTIEIVPYTDLNIELSWDAPGYDLDLHLIKPGGSYYGDGDCYFGNPTPDWGEIGAQEDNPNLALDDEGIEMREQIELKAPEEGSYTLLVHYYSISPEATTPYTFPYIKITAEQAVLYEGEGPRLIGEGMIWVAGSLDWSTLTFTPDETVANHSDLGGPSYNE